MLRTLSICLLLPLSLAAQTAATSPAPDTPKPRPSGVTISVPLLVREKKGAPVASLAKDDLTLNEDSAAQAILTLGSNSGQPLVIGILVDTSAGQRGLTAEEKTASQGFIDAVMKAPQTSNGAPTVKAFVVHFDREVELLQDLTASKDQVQHGVSLLDSPVPPDAGNNTGSEKAGVETQLYDSLFLATDEITSKQTGRKILVVFSSGIDRGSRETLRTVIDTAQRAGTTIYAVYVKGEEQKRSGQGRQRGGPGSPGGDPNDPGNGYPGGYPGGGYPGGGYPPGGSYPGGGYPGSGYPGSGYPGGYPGGNYPGGQRRGPLPVKVDGKRILADIVTPTGGRVFELSKKESAAQIYGMIEDDLAHQSVLTFMPDKAGARPGFHSLRIESKRKDTVVEARDGFYIKDAD